MANATDTLRGYIADLISVLRHTCEAVERQSNDSNVCRVSGASRVVQDINQMLRRQLTALEQRQQSLGGSGMVGTVKEAVTSVTGFITGLYDKMRSETASRALRDDYTALNFIYLCTGMLHTTALAVRDVQTAELTRQNMDELPPRIMALHGLVPHAVVADLGADGVPISDAQAADTAVRSMENAWRSISAEAAAF